MREPVISPMGVDALLVTFADALSEAANRAALAFAAAVRAEGLAGLGEVSSTLVSVYIAFDPVHLRHEDLTQHLERLLKTRDWLAADLPEGRRRWTIPVTLDGPQFAEAAELAGASTAEAAEQIAQSEVQVLTLGFAPGQPYLGTLPEQWDIPRQSQITPQVPAGALLVAVRQLIIFAGPAPTGWRHIGNAAFRCFRPDAAEPIALRPGDAVRLRPVSVEDMAELAADPSRNGGAEVEDI